MECEDTLIEFNFRGSTSSTDLFILHAPRCLEPSRNLQRIVGGYRYLYIRG